MLFLAFFLYYQIIFKTERQAADFDGAHVSRRRGKNNQPKKQL